MCELLGLSSSAPATVNFSLSRLADHGAVSGTLHDGWGIGYYEDLDVRLIKDATAVRDSDWVRFITGHHLRSELVIAHTRTATRGKPSYANAQPFVRELAGRAHLFAHNGDLPGIFTPADLQPKRFKPIGDTDSEQALCVLLDRMLPIWTDRNLHPPLCDRFAIVASFARELRGLGPANFLYSDGEVLFAHGDRRKHADTGRVEAPGLVLLQRQCEHDAGFATSGVSIGGGRQIITLVASVPLTTEPWQPLVEGELIAVAQGQLVGRQKPGHAPVFLECPATSSFDIGRPPQPAVPALSPR